MKTIYFYGIDNNKGGIEVYAYNLIKDICAKTNEFHFHIISQFEDFSFKNELVKLGCTFTIVPKRKKHPFKYSKAIKNILSNAKADDLLQLNIMSYRNIFLFKATKKTNVKTIVVGHSTNTDNKINYLIHKIGSLFYKNIGTKVANNMQIINHLCGSKCKNYQIIELGIHKELFKFDGNLREQIRNQLNIKTDEFLIGQVGRVCKTKNQLFSCEIIKNLNNPKIKLYCYGKILDNKAIKYTKRYKLNNIEFLGEVQNINQIYNAFDLLILPSHHESAGFVLYEALENGCPAIISDNVPTDGIESECLLIKKLKKHDWENAISDAFNKKWARNFNNKTPSHEDQIIKYIELYKSL